jgi:DNA-binding NtrC family response regulator
MKKALIVEDDELSARALAKWVQEKEACETVIVGTLAEACRQVAAEPPEIALVDIDLPDGNGLDLHATLAELAPSCPMVVITGNASFDTAVEALRLGAADYLTKPIDLARLKAIFAQLRRQWDLTRQVGALRSELIELGRFEGFVGSSAPMQKVFRYIERVAPSQASVLVFGESGTGKELVALAVHRLSPRRERPFVPVNCGAISPTLIESELFGHERGSFTGADRQHAGYFERASGGTLFLDEVSEMPIELQAKLLRVLETGSVLRVGGSKAIAVDPRVIAATHRNLDKHVEEGRFREDLLYRLNVFPIQLPPLRDRGDDVELLAQHFLTEINRAEDTRKRLAPEALVKLRSYSWPGNVRELKNLVHRAAILADSVISPEDIPLEPDTEPSLEATPQGNSLRIVPGTPLAEVQRRVVLATLQELGLDRTKTADALGISVRTLYNWLKEYGEPGDGRGVGGGAREESLTPP